MPAFQQVLDEHGPAVWRYLSARLGPDDAADAYQETMIVALRHYPTLEDDGRLLSWLLTVARHRTIDEWRARDRRPTPVEDPPEVVAHDPPLTDGGIWDEVRALPDAQRDALALRYGADLAYADIAGLLGCSEAAARQRVRTGLISLRTRMEGHR
jgi:DNA-directed RNA polymerase specialized sigma24 family protein